MTVRKQYISTDDLKDAMSKRWKAPQDALIWEVGDATGGRQNRNADAVIMGLYPSRGIHLDGVEIKTYRSDWLRELKNPAKAEAVSRYCDHWWIHATPDVVKVDELPEGWGLRIWDGRIWTTAKQAAKRNPEPVSREFLASLLRRSDGVVEKQAKRIAQDMLAGERAAMAAEIDARVQQRTRDAAAFASIAEEFKREFGLDPQELVRNGEVAHAVRMAAAFLRQDLHNPWGGLFYLVRNLRDLADRTSDALEEMGLDAPDPTDRLPRPDRARTKPIRRKSATVPEAPEGSGNDGEVHGATP